MAQREKELADARGVRQDLEAELDVCTLQIKALQVSPRLPLALYSVFFAVHAFCYCLR